jgi:hypothetical protein
MAIARGEFANPRLHTHRKLISNEIEMLQTC